ncbi:hypothetical protein MTO96_008636 [Rhipicephalus appendiculatus]
MRTGSDHRMSLLGGFMMRPNLELFTGRSEEGGPVSDVASSDPGGPAVGVKDTDDLFGCAPCPAFCGPQEQWPPAGPKEARSLHGLHVLRSAHFLSLLAEAVGVSWCQTTALFDSLLESLQRRDATTDSGATDVRVGMLLMDYRAQAAATRTLVADVFLTLSKAVAAVWLEAATLVSDLEPEPASPQPELYNLFVNGATASLCSCLKLCQASRRLSRAHRAGGASPVLQTHTGARPIDGARSATVSSTSPSTYSSTSRSESTSSSSLRKHAASSKQQSRHRRQEFTLEQGTAGSS